MFNSGLVSVIVPVYNAEKTIENCVKSILKQSYKNIEVLLVNDGSTDSSLKKCLQLAETDSRIVCIDKKNGGASSARNLGVTQSRGQFIEFVDSDDTIERNYIESLHRPFIENNNIDITIAGFTIVSKDSKQKRMPSIEGMVNFDSFNDTELFWQLFTEGFGFVDSPINKMYRKDKFMFFDETITISEDKVQNLNYLQNCSNLYLVADAGYNYIMTENSLSHRKYLSLGKDLQKADDKMIEFINYLKVKNYKELSCIITIETLLRVIRHLYSQDLKCKEIKTQITEMIKNDNLSNTIKTYRCKNKYGMVARMLARKHYGLLIWWYRVYVRVKRFDLNKI